MDEMLITQATLEDAPAILGLQRLAFEAEAVLYNERAIPALTQTLEQVEAEFEDHLFLKAERDGVIVGSVRGKLEDKTSCYIGRLMVHPDYQGQGIGKRLMAAIEARFSVERFYLFTGERSTANIHLYEGLGYREFDRKVISPKVTLVRLEKLRTFESVEHGVSNGI